MTGGHERLGPMKRVDAPHAIAPPRAPGRLAAVVALALAALLAACAEDAATQDAAPTIATPAEDLAIEEHGAGPSRANGSASPYDRRGGIAALLAKRPPRGQVVELDVWFGEGYLFFPGRDRAEAIRGCPSRDASPLTDRPLWQTLAFGGSARTNTVSQGEPYLVADLASALAEKLAADGAERPGFARVRGRFPLQEPTPVRGSAGEPSCQHAGRVFRVEEILETYSTRRELGWLPGAPPEEWTIYRNDRAGYELRRPPDWELEEQGAAILLRSPHWPDAPLVLLIEEARSVELTPVAGQDRGFNAVYRQSRQRPDPADGARPPLEGQMRGCEPTGTLDGCLELRARLIERELVARQEYGTGSDAIPGLLRTTQHILDSIVVDAWPTVTPPPEVRYELGDGPFWDGTRAAEHALLMIESTGLAADGAWRVAAQELISEGEALARDRCDMRREAGNDLYSYPEGVWHIELEAGELRYHSYIGAEDGAHLCTAPEEETPTAPSPAPAPGADADDGEAQGTVSVLHDSYPVIPTGDLARSSAAVLEVTVERVGLGVEDGLDEDEPAPDLRSTVILRVDRRYKGAPELSHVVISRMGGSMRNETGGVDREIVTFETDYAPGDELLMFLDAPLTAATDETVPGLRRAWDAAERIDAKGGEAELYFVASAYLFDEDGNAHSATEGVTRPIDELRAEVERALSGG